MTYKTLSKVPDASSEFDGLRVSEENPQKLFFLWNLRYLEPSGTCFLKRLKPFPQRLVRLADHQKCFRVRLVDNRLQLLDLGTAYHAI